MKTESIITSNDELIKMVKDGQFFLFCVAFALNKGFSNVVKERKDVVFSVGDYEVMFKGDEMCFCLSHKIYFARIIQAYYSGVHFVGDSEEEVINELLIELEKELLTPLIEPNTEMK